MSFIPLAITSLAQKERFVFNDHGDFVLASNVRLNLPPDIFKGGTGSI